LGICRRPPYIAHQIPYIAHDIPYIAHDIPYIAHKGVAQDIDITTLFAVFRS
jgi:hypothetical protein